MNLVSQLKQFLIEEKIVSPKDKINVSLAIGDINRKKSRLTRRYLISKKSIPLIVVRFIPKNWLFSTDDILKTYSVYSTLQFVKIPHLIGAHHSSEGTFFLEEYLKSSNTLYDLVEANELDASKALGILRDIYTDIWNVAEKPSDEFIREEKNAYRKYLTAFVQEGIFGDVVLDYVDKIIDQYSSSLRQAWSTGDIMDRNILRCGNAWYLVDFEYSHKTLFLFKEAFRNIHYSKWAQSFSLRDAFPALGDFPEEVAKLLSLSWDQFLQYQIVEKRSHQPNFESLRRTFWSVFDLTLPLRIDKHVAALQELVKQKEIQVAQLRNENQNQQQISAEYKSQVTQLQNIVQRIEQASKEKEERISQLQNIVQRIEQASKEKEERISQLQNIVQRIEQTSKEKEGRISQLQNMVQKLEQASKEKDERVQQLQNSMRILEKTVAETKNELAKSQNIIGQRDKILTLREQEIKYLQGEIRKNKEQISQLRTQVLNRERFIAEKDRRINELSSEVDRIHKTQQVIFSSIGFIILKSFWKVKDTLLSIILRKKKEETEVDREQQTSGQSSLTAKSPVETPIVPVEEVASPLVQKPASTGIVISTVLPEDITSSADIPPAIDDSHYRAAYLESLQVSQNKISDDFVPLTEENYNFKNVPVKLIAFYLPQFHPIPENDVWWGKGFVEWRNVSKAVPQFEGHYQPHLPGELGFYDLRVPEVQRRQVELAKKYGIYGFCFHYYWFNGKRLLERPLQQFISDTEIDFPFCICWANENWTRRWDGMDNDVLIAQVHSEESDLAFIKDIEPLLRHKNYIRINGQPLIIVYRVPLMPNPVQTAKRWKEYCKEVGLNEPYLIAAQSFGFTDPSVVGFDAAVEFPPHNIGVQDITSTVKLLNPNFTGKVYSFPDMAEKMKVYNSGARYKFFKTVTPSWDNEARKPGNGRVYANSSPEVYSSWLESACKVAMQNPNPDERIVFINAWNEWAESAYLEPDRKYGYAYLESTKQVLKKVAIRYPKISVIIPNYNHEKFIVRRLESVINQSYKPDEIIFLDDASTDSSLKIAEGILKGSNIEYKIISNKTNSGSVFKQWLKGIENAKGDLIWIAESDDDADTDFLRCILPQFQREDILLAYGDISYINPDGSKNEDLSNYYDGLSPEYWKSSHVRTAHDLFNSDFAVKNIIPNVSGAVFRKPILAENEVKRLLSYKFAGDFYFYALISRGGSISFCKEAKSYFRLNRTSTSRSAFFTQRHIDEHKMLLEDFRALHGISEEAVVRHAAELHRVLSLCGISDKQSSKDQVLKSIQPSNVKEKLKICIASYGFIVGGGEVVPIMLANALRDLGHHVTFLVMHANLPKDPSPLRRRLRPDIPVLKWDDCASTFGNIVKEFGFDIINSHNVDVEYRFFLNHIIPNVPYVASLHGGYETVPHLLTQEFISYLSRTVDAWLYLSEKNIAPLVNNGLRNGRFYKVFNAIAPYVHKDCEALGVRARLQLPKDSIVLVLASRALYDKGWGIAIDATRKLRKETGRDIRLVLIGDGEDLQMIQEHAKDAPYVHFMGCVENAGAMIHDCDFGIFPSTYKGESFPLFILECFAYGLPVITTDVGAIREMMVSEAGEVAGALISPKQDNEIMAAEIAEAIRKLLCNQDALKSAQKQARKRAEYYSINKLVDKYIDIFESISIRKKG